MSDKTEYSRLLLKRTGTPGVVPTIPTGNTLSTFIDTDTFIGEIFVNVNDDSAWIRTNNGQIPLLVSGSTAASLAATLLVGNQTGANDIEIDSNQVIRNPLSLTPDDAFISLGTTARPNEIRLQSADLSSNELATIVIDNSTIQMSSNDAPATTTALLFCTTNGGVLYDLSDAGGNVNISTQITPLPQLTFSVFNNATTQDTEIIITDTTIQLLNQDPANSITGFLTIATDPTPNVLYNLNDTLNNITITTQLQPAPNFITSVTDGTEFSSDSLTPNFTSRVISGLGGATKLDTTDTTILLQAGSAAQQLLLDAAGGGSLSIDIPRINLLTATGAYQAFANDAAAGLGGLVLGDLYQTTGTGAAPLNAAGILMIKQ